MNHTQSGLSVLTVTIILYFISEMAAQIAESLDAWWCSGLASYRGHSSTLDTALLGSSCGLATPINLPTEE